MKTLKILTGIALFVAVSAFAVENFDLIINGYGIGDQVEDFSLENVDGKQVSLADYKDAKGFIVIFTCNTCPFSGANENRIIALDKKYKAKGYPVIAINPNNPDVVPDESFEMMQQRAKEKNITFPYLYDESQSVYSTFGATKTPHVFILQKEEGFPIVKYIGAIDDSSRDASGVEDRFVENAVDELLAGKAVTMTETKAIGCGVKQ